ncbi:hypothetical protein Leryth_011573 [Lithospermum erythrorhizon]|nr:hypothetical protein Leryth_011573 [Lithospermum erythrorhizon]
MGTFMGHLVPGLALALLGLWHMFNTTKVYFEKGPKKFTSKLWYPLKCSLIKLHHFELILILSFSIFTILIQVVEIPSLRFSLSLVNLEHSTMFLHLSIFACFTLVAELTHSSETLSGVSGILLSSVFIQEMFLLYYHSTDHVGLEGHYHWLLQLIVCVSVLAAISSTVCPTNFPAALVLCISVMFQGCWFMNMGFNLWFPKFVSKGCLSHGAVVCETNEAVSRATALANLQFSWIIAAILMLTAFISLICARNGAAGVHSSQYEQLHNRAADISIDEVARLKLGHV